MTSICYYTKPLAFLWAIILMILLFINFSHAQEAVIRGVVVDQFTQEELPGAHILALDQEGNNFGTMTDVTGKFRIESLAPGRYTIQASYIGYRSFTSQYLLTSAKETVLKLELTESVSEMEAVVITGERDRFQVNNEFALVSSKSFHADETRRYAGSLNDPSRMAANFAGVVGANDARNDIVIRGNTPSGLLFRVEGLDIPNPNHFAAMGTTGGPVSILNNNVLGRSDFLTGAFPAGFGNASSGVFDLTLRNGNDEKREYTGQIGFNGFELGAEGPLGSDGSYLLNYRYSTLAVFKAIGLDIATGQAVPQYQDVSFKVDFGKKKWGQLSLFGLGGKSYIELLNSEDDEENLYSITGRNIFNGAEMGVAGARYKAHIGADWHTEVTSGITYNRTKTNVDSLDLQGENPSPFYGEDMQETRWNTHWKVKKKVSKKLNFTAGSIFSYIWFNYQDSVYQHDKFAPLRTNEGSTSTFQTYLQGQYKFSDNLIFNAGLHSHYLALSDQFSIEPRLGLQYEFKEAQYVNAAFGRHSQMPFLFNLFYKDPNVSDDSPFTNSNLGFMLSDQYVVGYENRKIDQWSFKLEAYYQKLTQVAVEQNPSSFSMLNYGADFGIPAVDSLVSAGVGENIGVELTVQRAFSKGFYLLSTGSLFRSIYAGSDGIWRNTAFNNRFVGNFLAGKEMRIGEKSTLAIDLRVTQAGGRFFTPIDLTSSIEEQEAVYLDNQAFSEKFNNYFRMDFRLTYRINGPKVMQEWFLDLQNLTNTQNPFMQQYSPIRQEVMQINQLGFFPMFNYRIQF